MKYYKIIILGIILSGCLISCKETKEEPNMRIKSKIVPVDTNNRMASLFQMTTYIGHPARGCNGCVYIDGEWVHVPCMGTGDVCAVSEVVSLEEEADGSYSITTIDTTSLTSEPFFNMPDRSLCVQISFFGPSLWLNIPAQLVFRDPETGQFTFTGLFYSDYQYYSNN